MSAETLLRLVCHSIFVFVFLVVARRALAAPTKANLHITTLFGVVVLFVVHYWAVQLLELRADHPVHRVFAVLVLAMPLILLWLANDFARVERWAFLAGATGLLLCAVALLLFNPPPAAALISIVAYFFVLSLYVVHVFWAMRRAAAGVTRRRLTSIAFATLMLAVVVVIAGIGSSRPDYRDVTVVIVQVLALVTAMGYFLGFAPPSMVRRAWQHPELISFLSTSSSLLTTQDQTEVVRAIETGVARALGGARGSLGLIDAGGQVLTFITPEGTPFSAAIDGAPSGEVFRTQRARAWDDMSRANPGLSDVYRKHGVKTMLCAPLTAGNVRLGVLVVFANGSSIFAEDDLRFLELLADHVAIVLESRLLLRQQAQTLAREEANQLKEDFLSAAAHDLRTPLSTIVAQAQLMEIQAMRDPARPPDAKSVQRILNGALRLKELVSQLLDATRLEQGKLLEKRTGVDLVRIVNASRERIPEVWQRCVVKASGPIIGDFDVLRIEQLVDNLLENAAKYSPGAAPIDIELWQEEGEARMRITDTGIGIPATDVPNLFSRFFRASNVNDRRYPGMGLGLFICRSIVEQHGGRIWVGSTGAQGTSIEIALPVEGAEVAA